MENTNKHTSRKLSAAEERRQVAFDALCAELEAKGYTRTPLLTDVLWGNVFGTLLGIVGPLVYVALFVLVNRPFEIAGELDISFSKLALFLVVFLVLVVVHELLHGITWAAFSPNRFRDIEFGFIKEYLTPYCTCKVPLSKGAYIAGAIMPLVILGVLPACIGIVTGSVPWLAMGAIMTMAAGGDALIILKILRFKTGAADVLYIDHPTDIGVVVFERSR